MGRTRKTIVAISAGLVSVLIDGRRCRRITRQ